jgi:hypothetical protein
MYVRPYAAKGRDKHYEYGNKRGVEASVSFIVKPIGDGHVRSDKDEDGVSFRFDREGRLVDESPFSERRDPVRQDGLISLDISSMNGDAASPGTRIGACIAAGNLLRSQKAGKDRVLYHNTHFFDQKRYGDADGFAAMANYAKAMAEARLAATRQSRAARLALKGSAVADQKSAA